MIFMRQLFPQLYFIVQRMHKLTREQSDKQNVSSQANGFCKPKIGQEIKARVNRSHLITPQASLELPSQLQSPLILSRSNSSQAKSVRFDDDLSSASREKHSRKSILKNSIKDKSKSNLKGSTSGSIFSHLNGVEQSVQNTRANKIIWEKYNRLLEHLRVGYSKFTDSIYPPVASSLRQSTSLMKGFCDMLEADGKSIQWMRLSQLYSHLDLVIWSSEVKSRIGQGAICGECDYLAAAFNSIHCKNNLMERIFGSQPVNKFGIYILKMHQTQTNNWKNVIIDDYIPVLINKRLPEVQRYLSKNVIPAFLNVQPEQKVLELWPYLLQKAYAKYYSNYDALSNGNTLDFIEEITGVLFDTAPIEGNLKQINKYLHHYDTILLAEDRDNVMHPLKNAVPFEANQLLYRDRNNSFKQMAISHSQFTNKFQKVYYGFIHKFIYSATCAIRLESSQHSKETIVRSFTLSEASECEVGLIQKEQRFFKTYNYYSYSWIRLILLMKEPSGWRWISGSYSNTKSVKTGGFLEAGQYTIIILPEWAVVPYDLGLSCSSNICTEIVRKPSEEYDNVLIEGCLDLAQRHGQLIQINKDLCSYNFISRDLGLIIENINNEKARGSIKIVRSIEGLLQFGIESLNKQFKASKVVEMILKPSGSFTVVLKTSKGVNKALLDTFKFDNQ